MCTKDNTIEELYTTLTIFLNSILLNRTDLWC